MFRERQEDFGIVKGMLPPILLIPAEDLLVILFFSLRSLSKSTDTHVCHSSMQLDTLPIKIGLRMIH